MHIYVVDSNPGFDVPTNFNLYLQLNVEMCMFACGFMHNNKIKQASRKEWRQPARHAIKQTNII